MIEEVGKNEHSCFPVRAAGRVDFKAKFQAMFTACYPKHALEG